MSDTTFIVGQDKKKLNIAAKVNQGNQLSISDALLEISLGNVAKYAKVIIEGCNMDVDLAAIEDIWSAGGDLVYLAAAETMNIKSTVAADDSVGTGARTVKVKGIDGTHVQVEETVIMDGVANVLTVNSYLRVFSIEVLTAGSGEKNAGDITATASTAATVQCFVTANMSVSKNSQFTVPAGKTMIVLGAEINATKIGAGLIPNIKIRAMLRKLGDSADAPWIEAVGRRINTEVQDQLLINQPVGNIVSAKTDIRFTAETDIDNSEVRVRLYAVLIDD